MEKQIRMHLEPLTRAIETADPIGFREIVMRYLDLRGYHEVESKDGRNDGGSDFAVRTLGDNPTPLAIASTVQRAGWKAKVGSDCRRAKEALGLTNVLYVSSHRRSAVEFNPIAEALWEKDDIQVRSVDSQALADTFFQEKEARVVLDAVGISFDERRPDAVQRPDLSEDAAYAFALFGDASEKFRHSVVEQTVLSYLIDARGECDTREDVESRVADALQLADDQRALVSSAIDRMLQQQRLQLLDGHFSVQEDVVESFKVMRALREKQWKELLGKVDGCLAEAGLMGAGLVRASQAVMERAGALVMCAATATSAAIGIEQDPAPIRRQLRKRLKEITAELLAARMVEERIDPCVEELAGLIANSEIGHVLMAGELFVTLAATQTNEFERAFGASGGSEIHLDASVAIPMIAALLYEPAETRFSKAALRIFELAERRGIQLMLPKVYLEEAASHLLDALERYKPLLGSDSDLRFSTNAYVAHFSDLTARGVIDKSLLKYAENLGYTEHPQFRPRQVEEISRRLAVIFGRYNIKVVELSEPSEGTLRLAEEAMTFTANDLGAVRHGRLLKHDAAVIAQFMEIENRTDVVRIFCTWDKLHLKLRTERGRAQWQPLDPPMLGDVLILTRPSDGEQLMTTVDLAMELDQEEGQRGAAVLDTLVRIEQGKLHDAELLGMVHDFKDAYMQALRDNAEPEDTADAWSAWKSGNRDLLRQPELPLRSPAD